MGKETNQKGYYIITQKKRLYTNYEDYIRNTQKIFNDTTLKYYNLIFEHMEFLELSNQNCLRELEKLTLKSKNGETPQNYFDLDVPSYLRRAAINNAIGLARSYHTKYKKYLENKEKLKEPSKATNIKASFVCYKGMYKDLYKDSVKIKLFNGNTWNWYKVKIKESNFKENEEILSPTIVVNRKYIMLHIPVKQEIEDISPVKERMNKEHVKVCGIAFSNSDSFAICVILDENRKLIKTKYIKGGKEYKARTSKILAQIKKHRQNERKWGVGDHKSYWKLLYHISDEYAHKVSKQIVDFCKENEVKVISIADMDEDVTVHFGKKVGKYSPIYLRKRIVKYLQYKAFKDSIIITKVRKNYIGSKCYICRGYLKRNKLKYECENGHLGDYFFNSAMNIGIMCLKKFGK